MKGGYVAGFFASVPAIWRRFPTSLCKNVMILRLRPPRRRLRLPAVARVARHLHLPGGPRLPDVLQMVGVDDHRHPDHRARGLFRLLVVIREIERRQVVGVVTLEHVTVLAPHAEPLRKAPHGLNELLDWNVLRERLKVRRGRGRPGGLLSLRTQTDGRRTCEYDEQRHHSSRRSDHWAGLLACPAEALAKAGGG